MKELKGLCKNCMGCNKLEQEDLTGVYRCEYATDRQISMSDLRKELKK